MPNGKELVFLKDEIEANLNFISEAVALIEEALGAEGNLNKERTLELVRVAKVRKSVIFDFYYDQEFYSEASRKLLMLIDASDDVSSYEETLSFFNGERGKFVGIDRADFLRKVRKTKRNRADLCEFLTPLLKSYLGKKERIMMQLYSFVMNTESDKIFDEFEKSLMDKLKDVLEDPSNISKLREAIEMLDNQNDKIANISRILS